MITIQQDPLQSALNAVTRASTKSPLQAVFALVRMDVDTNGILQLSCFNGETAARATLNVDGNGPLSVQVDAQTLKAVVETLTGAIRIAVEDHTLVLQVASNRTTLHIVQEPMPVIGSESIQPITVLSGIVFRSLMRVLPFASTDDGRAALQVMHLELTSTSITAQTSDGYSAATVSENIEGPREDTAILLPLSIARLLSTLVEERDTVRVGRTDPNRMLFQITHPDSAKDLTLATVTASANFPAAQIKTLIEEARRNFTAHLQVQQLSLLQSLRMVNAMGTQSTFLKVSQGAVRIASAETDTGQARNLVEGTASGENTSAWLSAVFMKRAVEACKGELCLRMTNGQKPIVIEAGSFTSVIMPMVVEGGKDPFPEDEVLAISLPDMAMA